MKYIVTLNGTDYEVEVNELGEATVTDMASPTAAPEDPVRPGSAPVDGAKIKIAAPMSGTIQKVAVSAGQTVSRGDVLFILEAMKMENEIFAPSGGAVLRVLVDKGSTVSAGDALAFIG